MARSRLSTSTGSTSLTLQLLLCAGVAVVPTWTTAAVNLSPPFPVSQCPTLSTTADSCFVIDGTNYINTFKTVGNSMQGSASCCSACHTNSACVAYQYNLPDQGGNASVCFLIGGTVPHVKTPVHPAQTDCQIGYPTPPPTPRPRPVPKNAKSVLYVLCDDLRTQMGPYGHTNMHTPNLDAFASSAMLFEQAHVQSQMCVPTRNSFMSGRRPQTTRVFNDGIGNKHFRVVGANWTSLPQYFKESGYFTVGAGKTFHPNLPPNFDQPYSWSNETKFPYYYPPPNKCPTDNGSTTDVWCSISNKTAVFEDLLILAEGQRRLTIAAKEDTPFFVAVGFHKPHTPYRAPSSYFDLYPPLNQIDIAEEQIFPNHLTGLAWFSCIAEGAQYPIISAFDPYPVVVQQELRRAYYASVSFFDNNLGELLKTVDSLELTDDLIVVFHADHGYQLGERNIYCKETNFNLATHVPLMIRAPHYPHTAGTRYSGMVEIIDIMPTLIDLAGLPPLNPALKGEPALEGNSLVPIMQAQNYHEQQHQQSSVDADMFGFAFSQYARARCPENLFVNKNCATTVGHYNGFSIRNETYRYTRWTQVTITGDPMWDEVVAEEFYNETLGNGDDYDASERVNVAHDPRYHTTMTSFAAKLKMKMMPTCE